MFLSLIAHRSFTLTLYQQGKEKSKTKLVLLPCYPGSRDFSLVWYLAFTKSMASLVSRVVGLSPRTTS